MEQGKTLKSFIRIISKTNKVMIVVEGLVSDVVT